MSDEYEWITVGVNRKRRVKKGTGTACADIRRNVSLYPYTSDALGCTPDHAKAETEFASRQGVDVEYTPQGEAVITSAKQRDRLMSIYGIGGSMKSGRK